MASSSTQGHSHNYNHNHHHNHDRVDGEGPGSPRAPPFSPITPVMSLATLAPTSHRDGQDVPPDAAQRPSPVPISESENPDAIALRSAISVLQIQRQRTLQDLKTLDRQKREAVADPERFARDLASGKITTATTPGFLAEARSEPAHTDDGGGTTGRPAFGTIPAPQNVVRTPPINWDKYHVVGEALDKLHEEQTLRPTGGEPHRDGERGGRAPEHVIAAPYRPWADGVAASPARTRSTAKKDHE
ncbi:hypothetical protein MMC19_003077 [Ptychographa xylographoides]|nr:hypothetical protein [Ptychographa xylographoides]